MQILKIIMFLLLPFLFFSCSKNKNEQIDKHFVIHENESKNVLEKTEGSQGLIDEHTENIMIKTESAGFPYVFVLEEIDVYDYPNMIFGNVIYTLEIHEDVFLSEISIDVFEINGKYEHWYKITYPIIGWLFAAKFAR